MEKSARRCEFNRDKLGSSPRLTIHFDCQNTTLHKLKRKSFINPNQYTNQKITSFSHGGIVTLRFAAAPCTAHVRYRVRQQNVGVQFPHGMCANENHPRRRNQCNGSKRNKPPWAVEPKRFLQPRQWRNRLGDVSLIATSWVQVPD